MPKDHIIKGFRAILSHRVMDMVFRPNFFRKKVSGPSASCENLGCVGGRKRVWGCGVLGRCWGGLGGLGCGLGVCDELGL